MNKKDLLMDEIVKIPDPYLDEMLDFIHFPSSDLTQAKRRPALVITILNRDLDTDEHRFFFILLENSVVSNNRGET